jgi:hypothetical protein
MLVERAQAGIEYLVTYGWLMIFIVTVASVLMFSLTPKSTQFRCSSDQPASFPLQAYNVPEKYHSISVSGEQWFDNGSETEPIEISLENASGENIRIIGVECWNRGKYFSCDSNTTGFFSNLGNLSKINGRQFSSLKEQQLQVNQGAKILVKNFAIIYSQKNNFLPPGRFRFSYITDDGKEKKFTVNCDGYPSTPEKK